MKNHSLQSLVILGAGNVAWHLQRAFHELGLEVLQCWRRGEVLNPSADVYLLCVSDDALVGVLPLLPKHARWAHTSACAEVELGEHGGVFYPLQTFTKGVEVDFQEVPIFVEAPDKQWRDQLLMLAQKISNNVALAGPQQRVALHSAAVFASNFTNHLLALAEQVLKRENLEMECLYPLIRQTFEKALLYPPEEVQTGPARRGDRRTQQRHMKYLTPSEQEIYKCISESIRRKYAEKS